MFYAIKFLLNMLDQGVIDEKRLCQCLESFSNPAIANLL